MGLLRQMLGTVVEPVDAVGWQGDALEAQAFGYLAVRSQLGLPLSLPGTTGVPQPVTAGASARPEEVLREQGSPSPLPEPG